MPGLIRGMARTAVVAGTATAVAGRVQRRQAERFADRDAQIYAQQEAAYEQQAPAYQQPAPAYEQPAPAAAAPAAAAPATQDDMVAKLQQLGDMHQQGILSDDEFAAAKARLLGN